MQRQFDDVDDIGIAWIYFSYKQNVTPVDIFASILKQLALTMSSISTEIHGLYCKHLKTETRPTFSELSEILQSQTRNCSTVFIVLDALDECSDQNTRVKVLSELKKLQSNLRLMTTGRPNITEVTDIFKDTISVDIRASDNDLEKYVEAQIENHIGMQRHIKKNGDLRTEIQDTIVSKANGM